MKLNIVLNNEKYVAGTTLKDDNEFENNNMALYVGENIESVLKNREKLASVLNCKLEDFVCANQTHSPNFYKVTSLDKGRGAKQNDTAIANTDALYTYEPNLLLCCFTADCVPVIFYNEKKGLVGVIHSGWQGTIKEISIKLFRHLEQSEGCNPKDFHVYLGLSLSQERFEVDEDVYLKFIKLGYAEDFMYFNEETNKYHISNQQVVKRQCELAGIPTEQIINNETCTYLNHNGFSYRQNKKSGRHLNFIMRKEND